MSGWTMFNFEPLNRDELEEILPEDEWSTSEWLQRKLHEQRAIHWTCRYHGTVIGRRAGYRDWEDDESFVRSLHPEAWSRVVIIQANDTADIGAARLYSNEDGELQQVEEVQESQEEGLHVGDKAAASIFSWYNIPCMGNISYPVEFTVQSGEWSEDAHL